MKKVYKALITDVDGTLITNEFDGKLTPKVKKSVLTSKNCCSFGIASGRPLDRVIFLFDELELKQPCIVTGGAHIVDPVSKKILWEKPLLFSDAEIILKTLISYDTKIWVVDDTKEVLYQKDIAIKKPMSFFLSKIADEIADEIIQSLGHIKTIALTKVVAYEEGYVSLYISHAEATKKHALIKLAELMEIEQTDIVGVGDGYNDYALFKACGLRVAVGNAVSGLKEQADYIAPSVKDDGIAHVIEKFFLNQTVN